jgi:hypothetical protein
VKQWSEEDILRVFADPRYCLPRIRWHGRAILSEDQFVEAAAKAIRETGPEAWLRLLLDNLRG